jgi:hypothetical protein
VRRRWLAAALLAAGCGVQPSGVIVGAAPPSGAVDRSGALYLVRAGRVTPVQRPVRPGPPSTEARLDQLAAGPTAAESARGLTTEVPRSAAPFTVTVSGGVVTVRAAGGELSDVAVDQVVCTAAEPGSPVTVTVRDRSAGPRTCPVG